MSPVQVTLATAAAAFFLNMWLGGRVAALRRRFKVSVGDGGQDHLLRRMRAQANFIENAPIFLILLGGLELSSGNRWALGAIAAIFLSARVAHAHGMDAAENRPWRMWGMIGTTAAIAVLAIWALVRVGQGLLGG